MPNTDDRNERGTAPRTDSSSDWSNEESYWRNNYSSRPYATADRGFDYYRPGYQYGYESANQMKGRSWTDAENDLRSGWDSYSQSGDTRSTWEQIKHSVKDAWDRVTGHHHTNDSARRSEAM